MTYTVECKYSRNGTSEIISLFDKESDATSYSCMHNGEGGCILSVTESVIERPLEYEIRTIYSYGSVSYPYEPVSYPTGISFQFECEASSFAYRKARWKGGYLIVVHQPFSEADA